MDRKQPNDELRPFDTLDDVVGPNEDELQADSQGEEEAEAFTATKPPVAPKTEGLVWDFRHGKLPEGVTIIGDEGQAHLEVQQDRSTALTLPPKGFLKFDCTFILAGTLMFN